MNAFSAKAIDWANYLKTFDLVYKGPSRCWQDAITLGNGELTALAYESDGVYPEWTINHSSLWDERLPRFQRHDMSHIRRIASGELPFVTEMKKENPSDPEDSFIPTPKYGGQIRLGFGIAPQYAPGHRVRKTLHLHDASLQTDLDKHLSHPRIQSFICAEKNLLVISVRHVSLVTAFKNRIEVFRHPEPNLPAPELHVDGDTMFLHQTLPGQHYVMAVKIVPRGGGEYRELFEKITHPSLYASYGTSSESVSPECNQQQMFADVKGDFDLFITIVEDKNSSDLEKAAQRVLHEAVREGVAQLFENHCNWWHAFWEKNFVSLQEPFLDQLWYLSNYHLRCSLGGYPPHGLCGPWLGRTPTARQFLPWNGNYTNDYNSQLPMMVPGRINRPELADNGFQMLRNQLPQAMKNAGLFEQAGAFYPLTSGPGGEEISNGCYRFCQGSGPYWCVLLFQHYRLTANENFFKNIAWPIIREVSRFFAGYLIWDNQQSSYQLRCSQNPELMYLHLNNPVDTLAFLKYTLLAAITGAARFEQDPVLTEKCKHILQHFPQYPTHENGFLPLEGLRPDHIHHSRTLATVFPTGEADPLFPTNPLLDTARKELYSENWEFFMKTYACGQNSLEGWTGKVYHRGLPACRLGEKTLAWKFLEDMLATNLKPNGLISHNIAVLVNSLDSEKNIRNIPDRYIHHDHGTEPIALSEVASGRCWEEATEDLECKEKMFPVQEGPALFLLMISEMLMQCYNGILRLFPAWPEERNAEFRDLRAEGPVLVSAAKKNGTVLYVRLKALTETTLRLLNPWPGLPCVYQHGKGKVTLGRFHDLEIKAGEEIIFSPEAELPRIEPPEIFPPTPRFRSFSNRLGAFLGKPELSEYYQTLEKLCSEKQSEDGAETSEK